MVHMPLPSGVIQVPHNIAIPLWDNLPKPLEATRLPSEKMRIVVDPIQALLDTIRLLVDIAHLRLEVEEQSEIILASWDCVLPVS